ncbi:MAG: hypothetical protein DYH13_03515 [Alphaproteobacteria bacterium PRO2]|nr:hypothetical protein [Alphaproteobacteria bacterium PRO2]
MFTDMDYDQSWEVIFRDLPRMISDSHAQHILFSERETDFSKLKSDIRERIKKNNEILQALDEAEKPPELKSVFGRVVGFVRKAMRYGVEQEWSELRANLLQDNQELRDFVKREERHLHNLQAYLFMYSEVAEVRRRMETRIDDVIAKNLAADPRSTRIAFQDYCRDLLYFSQFGGAAPGDGTYRFNTDPFVTVPQSEMSHLFEAGLIKKSGEFVAGSNLTFAGIAVLQRLSETEPRPSMAAKMHKRDDAFVPVI